MSMELISIIILACIFIIPTCFISILLFIYYSKEQASRLFQAQIEAEAKALKARQSMEQFVEAMAGQYNAKLKDFVRWMASTYGIEEAKALDEFGEWEPVIPDSYYPHISERRKQNGC